MTSGMHKELLVHLLDRIFRPEIKLKKATNNTECVNHKTCGMLLNRKIWSERVEPGNTSPPIAIPVQLKNMNHESD